MTFLLRLLAALAVLVPVGIARTDVLHLVGGGTLRVGQWWEEDGTLYYQTDAGVIGIPRRDVVRIEADASDTDPSLRADANPPPEPSAASSRRDPAPSAKAPAPKSREQLSTAIERLETELLRAGSTELSGRIERGLADLHVLRARTYSRSGDVDRAIADYEAALARVVQHRPARIELGWLLLRQGDVHGARRVVETGLAAYPSDSHLLELQAELLYRDNRLADALERYRQALAARGSDPRLARRIEKIQREADSERGYLRADSQHFVLRYDGERDERLGRLLLDVLEESLRELGDEVGSWPVEPITVILYTRQQFHETTRTGPEVAGLFDGKIRLPVGGVTTITAGLRRVARHELVHALVHHRGRGRVPRWLHEGLAQWLEPRALTTVRPALALAVERGRAVGIEPFAYPTALVFTAFLDQRYSRTRLLWLIDLLAEGRPENDAFLEAFGAPREELIEEWRRWLSDRS
ncbi:MAG: tetratricopeptide repeat protein [Acidobacteriota bacterium]|nr:tetratricopeptide repeat protein [Acidobacteriota bacterium]